MDRRGFIQGLFGGVTSAGLIVAANPKEIEAFASPLAKDAPLLLDAPAANPHAGEHLYNSRGELVAIVTDVSVRANVVRARSWDHPYRLHSFRGPYDIDIRAVGIGTIDVTGDGYELRGERQRR